MKEKLNTQKVFPMNGISDVEGIKKFGKALGNSKKTNNGRNL